MDLIATLVFPSVAAGDLISHVHSYSRTGPSTRDGTSEQRSACSEASLVVIESFLAIDIILFLLAVGFKCIRRGCLLAAAGLFCFAAECYLSFSSHVGYIIYEYLDRSFLVTFKTLLIILLVTLSILATYAGWPAHPLFCNASSKSRARSHRRSWRAGAEVRKAAIRRQPYNAPNGVNDYVVITTLFLRDVMALILQRLYGSTSPIDAMATRCRLKF